jgi:adenine phosphoribosyltransferase
VRGHERGEAEPRGQQKKSPAHPSHRRARLVAGFEKGQDRGGIRSRVTMTLNLKDFVHDVPDFPKPGILFRDITPMLSDGPAFAAAIDQLDQLTRGINYTRIIGIESRGFIFGAALAQKRQCGFVPIRKPKKLPRTTVRETYALEYGEDTLEMHEDALIKGERALIVDDVLATGGTAEAAGRLVGRSLGEVAGFAFLIELDFLNGRSRLAPHSVATVLHY